MSVLVASIASALLTGAALQALLAPARAESYAWLRGTALQVLLGAVAAVATASPGTIAAIVVPSAKAAQTNITDISTTITTSLGSVTQLIVLGSYLAGLAFAAAASFKFKEHKDNPTQIPIPNLLSAAAMAIAGGVGTFANSAAVQDLLTKASGTG